MEGWITPSAKAAWASTMVKIVTAQNCLETFMVSPEIKVAVSDSQLNYL
jgi:hypothetical protein